MVDSRAAAVKATVLMSPLILASTSRYRAALLARLRIAYRQQAPEVDETPLPGESARQLATRLSLAKARAVAALAPGHWVLGSDQSASCGGRLLGKPGSREANCEQLAWLSGREANFVTGVALVCSDPARTLTAVDVTTVKLRRLKRAEIERYVDAEPAQDCAGGFKVEGLGISLFTQVRTSDPTALEGLPLIATARLLRRAGYALP